MNKGLLIVLLWLPGLIQAQQNSVDNTARRFLNWPLVVGLQFHNVAMPFRDLKSTFSNLGVSVGTDFSYNRRGNLLQSFQVGYHRNSAAGDGLIVQSQVGYKPHVGSIFGELKVGLGWLYAFHPTSTLTWRDDQWQSQTHVGKGLVLVPVGFSLGYENRKTPSLLSPFISYQLAPAIGYNPSVPLVPNQFLQIGSRINIR